MQITEFLVFYFHLPQKHFFHEIWWNFPFYYVSKILLFFFDWRNRMSRRRKFFVKDKNKIQKLAFFAWILRLCEKMAHRKVVDLITIYNFARRMFSIGHVWRRRKSASVTITAHGNNVAFKRKSFIKVIWIAQGAYDILRWTTHFCIC